MATTDLGKWMITDGGEYNSEATYEKMTMVMYKNSTYITLKTVTGVEPTNDKVNYSLMAQGFSAKLLSDVIAKDTNGALGTAGAEVSAQSLVDWVTDQVMTKLIKKTELVNNALATVSGLAALDSAMGKTLQDQIDQTNSNFVNTLTYMGDLPDNNANNAGVNGIYTLNPGTNMGTSGLSANFGVLVCFGIPRSFSEWRWQRAFYTGSFHGGTRTKTNIEGAWTDWTIV